MFAHKNNVKLTGFKQNQINMQFCPPIKQNRPETLFRASGRQTTKNNINSASAYNIPIILLRYLLSEGLQIVKSFLHKPDKLFFLLSTI